MTLKEVGAIVRELCGNICQGDVTDQEEPARKDLEEYGKYIFKMPDATIEYLIGEDLRAAAAHAKETAAGMVHWTPPDLKMLSP